MSTSTTRPRTESQVHTAGTWFENTKTKELGRLRVAPTDTGGRRLVADLWLAPGAAVLGEHVHDQINERFTVCSGTLAVRINGVESRAAAGGAISVPAGVSHDWWNESDTVARVLVEVEASPGGGPMAERFLEMIEVSFGLANTGNTNAEGKPHLLWLAAFATDYRDVLRLSSPPQVLQRALFGPLAAFARWAGRDPGVGWLHGPGCPAQIDVPHGYEEVDENGAPVSGQLPYASSGRQ
jgi:quercetin dioxygenase-like cupin family protein